MNRGQWRKISAGVLPAFLIAAVWFPSGPAAAQQQPIGCAEDPSTENFNCGTNVGLNDASTEVGFGAGFFSSGTGRTLIGRRAGQSDLLDLAIGDNVTAVGNETGRYAAGNANTAIGAFAGTRVVGNGNSSVGFDAGSEAQGELNAALGFRSGVGVQGSRNSAFGTEAGAGVVGSDNIAIGTQAGAQFDGGGNPVALNLNNTVALGNRAVASADGAVAIGAGVTATRANQVAIGGADATYTLAGIATDASRAEQVGDVYFVTSDAGGNLATTSFPLGDIAALDGRVGALESTVAGLSADMSGIRTEARQGIAAAIAMTTAPMPSAAGRTSWAANVGYFKGAGAFGGSFAHRLDLFDNPFAITGGYAYGGGDSHALRLGLAGEF